jgi:FemAB-related protein (PEP-CTERM system-associated)
VSAELRIGAATAADTSRWNNFVLAHPEATFFHRAEWATVLQRAFGHRAHYLLAERAGEVVGVLPLAELKSPLFGHSLVSTPFCVYGGVLAADAVAHVEFRNLAPRRDDWQRKDLYVTFRKPLAADDEAELTAIPRKARAEVRKGLKNGLVASVSRDPREWYELYAESLRNLGTPVFGRRYAEVLLEVFGADCEVLTLHSSAGVPLTSVLSFYFRGEVLPYYGGGGAAARSTGAHDLMYYEVMRRARALGCTAFDFGRSKRGTGSYSFKKNMGFTETPLAYEYRLVKATEMPNLSPTNPKYSLLINAWQRLPLWASKLVGPPLARSLG